MDMLKLAAPAEEFSTDTVVGKQMLSCKNVNSGRGSPRTTKGWAGLVWLQPCVFSTSMTISTAPSLSKQMEGMIWSASSIVKSVMSKSSSGVTYQLKDRLSSSQKLYIPRSWARGMQLPSAVSKHA